MNATCLNAVLPWSPDSGRGRLRCARCGRPIRKVRAGARVYIHTPTAELWADRRLAEATRNGSEDSWWEAP